MEYIGESAVTIRMAAEEFKKLKAAYEADDLDKCTGILKAIGRLLIHFPTYLSPCASSPTRIQELTLVRDVLELGALVSARSKNLSAFEQYFNQLQVYYEDVAVTDLPESPRYMTILGLNLLRLLVLSRIAEFHTELVKINRRPGADKDQCIRFAILLERCLMEGTYNKLLNSRKQAPVNEYLPVVEMLEQTVRDEVALCIPQSYNQLSLSGAQKILMLPRVQDVAKVGQERSWELSPDQRSFIFRREEDLSKHKIPFMEMIEHHIDYAADLQKII